MKTKFKLQSSYEIDNSISYVTKNQAPNPLPTTLTKPLNQAKPISMYR